MKNKKFTKRMFAVVCMMGLLYLGNSVSMAYQVEVSGDSTRVRQTASTDSDTISAVNKGDKLEVLSEVTASDGKVWYQVSINNIVGYIRSDTVKKVEASSGQTEQPAAQPAVAETVVTAMTSQSATIKEDSVNVRSQASTSANAVATVKKGTAITLTGTATGTDGRKWYQVSYINNGSDVKGFIREDLVTIGEAVPASEEGGGEAESPEGEAAEGGESPEDAELAEMYGDMPEEDGADAGDTAAPNQDYELKYDNNEWYVYDYTVNKRYKLEQLLSVEQVVNDYKESIDKDSNQQKIIIIVLAVLLVLAVAAAAFLGFKYYGSIEDEDDDDEEEEPRRSGFRRRSRRDEEDDEEDEEDEDDFEEARPVRRPVRKEEPRQRTREENRRSEGAGRRPAGAGQRRPRPEGDLGAPARPAGRGAAAQGQRRPRPENAEQRPVRRPAPAGQPRRPAPKAPAPEKVRTDSERLTAQPGKMPRSGAAKSDVTWKSKNFLTEDEDGLDFSFIDMNEDT